MVILDETGHNYYKFAQHTDWCVQAMPFHTERYDVVY